MSYDTQVTIRKGEKRLLYGVATLPTGLLTMTAGAKFSLYTSAGILVTAFNDIAVTGQSVAADETVQCWYLLDTAGLTTVTPVTVFIGIFTFTATSSADLIGRVNRPNVQIILTNTVDFPATYDQSLLSGTPLYQTRLLVADTDVSVPTWTDVELLYFLSVRSGVPALAAALALRTAAVDRAKVAVIIIKGKADVDDSAVPQSLLNMADMLETQAAIMPVVIAPDAVFTTTRDGGLSRGTMDGW